jgi:hypothetical protein
MSNDNQLRESLKNIASVTKKELEERPLYWGEKMIEEAIFALRATPPEGGRYPTPHCFSFTEFTPSPSLPAKEERRCKCGHTRLDHYPDSPCAICACEVYRPAPQPAAQNAALASQGDEIKALKARYNVLFELYADHIHDHRLGAGKACDGCKAMIDAQIDAALEPGCLDTKKASKFDPDGSEYEEESYQTGG